jgi:hypothetical protein
MIFTQHARLRMSERGITEAQVVDTYRGYETALPGSDGRRNYFKTYAAEGRKIRVTIAETKEGPVVVTVAEDPL